MCVTTDLKLVWVQVPGFQDRPCLGKLKVRLSVLELASLHPLLVEPRSGTHLRPRGRTQGNSVLVVTEDPAE